MPEPNNYPVWPGWETVRIIGRGSFGTVYEITRDIYGHQERAAMKVISIPQSDSDIEELLDSGYTRENVTDTFKEHIVAHLVVVDTGDLIDDDKAVADGIVSSKDAIEGYNFASLAKKDGTSVKINKEDDAAGILTHSKYMPVYFAKDGGKTVRIILPFYGQALWSTVYGYVAVSPEDGNTILGVTFYSHGETPGLGGEIDNPNFQKKWEGKKIQIDGNYAFKICKNEKDNQIDALSGATLTSNGVDNTAKYWFDVGYKPFLEKISKGEISVNE